MSKNTKQEILAKQVGDIVNYYIDNTEKNLMYTYDSETEKVNKEYNDALESNRYFDSLPNNYFKDVIDAANKKTDLDCGIIVYEYKKNKIETITNDENVKDNKLEVQIRDATKKHEFENVLDHPSKSKYSWITQAANFCQAAVELTRISSNKNTTDMNQFRDSMIEKFQNFEKGMQEFQGSPKEYGDLVKKFNTEIIESVKENKLEINGSALKDDKKIAKALNSARHFCMLESDHKQKINLVDNTEKTAVLAEVQIVIDPLSAEQKKQFESLEDQKWYQKIDDVSKALVDKHKESITSGKKVLSSQLKDTMDTPGLHNAMLSLNLDVTKTDDVKILGSNIRSGTLANTKQSSALSSLVGGVFRSNYDSKSTAETLKHTDDIAKSLGAEGVSIMNLNSDFVFNKKEKAICGNTENACEKAGIPYKNVAMSFSWSSVADKLNPFSKSGDKKAQKVEEMMEFIENTAKENRLVVIQCKSGKDRTGLLQIIKNTHEYAKDRGLNVDKLDEKIHKIFREAFTQEELASSFGGTNGVRAQKLGGVKGTDGGKDYIEKIGIKGVLDTNKQDKFNKATYEKPPSTFEKIINYLKEKISNLFPNKDKNNNKIHPIDLGNNDLSVDSTKPQQVEIIKQKEQEKQSVKEIAREVTINVQNIKIQDSETKTTTPNNKPSQTNESTIT